MNGERRGSPRGRIDCHARIATATGEVTARLKTVSRMGALLSLDHDFAVGTPVGVIVEVPGFADLLEVRGQVVRTERTDGGVEVAVMFAPLTAVSIAKLDSLVTTSED